MKFLMLVVLTSLNFCAIKPDILNINQGSGNLLITGNPEIDMQNPNIGIGKLSIKQKEQLYPYFDISIDDIGVDDPSIGISREEKIAILDSLDAVKFILNSLEFRNELTSREIRGDVNAVGCTGISISFDKPVDRERVAEAVRRFKYSLTVLKTSDFTHVASATLVEYHPFYPFPHPLFRQVPHFYVIDLDKLEPMKGRVKLHGGYDYSLGENPYFLPDLLLHEMIHNMGSVHGSGDPQYELLDSIEKAASRTYHQQNLFKKYNAKWNAFKGYYREKYAHLIK
ncbi:MAG: hypothetical protein ACRCTJ_02425 [Brevinema sp.]